MKNFKIFIWIVLAIGLYGCTAGAYTPASPTAQKDRKAENQAVAIQTQRPTAVPSATENPFLEIYVSQTAVKLEEIRLGQQAQQMQADQMQQNLRLTADAATSTVAAASTQTQRADNALALAETAGVPSTQIAGSATAVSMTRVANKDIQEYNASVFGIWLGKFFLLILLIALSYGMYLGFRALNFRMTQMAPDENGRFNLVAESSIPGTTKRLVNPNLAHRVGVSVTDDDLSAEQALQNTAHARQLEGIRVIAASQGLSRKLLNQKNNAQPMLPQTEDGRVSYPELPYPSWVDLTKWDGELLPVGNDENSKLLLVDTTLRPHLLYAGRSRSGKTLTGERTSVVCLLTQGWNVIVMGKRVDWMPFTDHPNFKLLAVDVRKDAQRYIDILQVLSAQMDIRDSLLTSKHIGTWGLYGAPSTMVVLDDYSGALIRMPASKAKEVMTEVRSISLDGAKFGISITIGLQDATAQNIDTTTRSQMARIVYSMDNAIKSRIALGSDGSDGDGAERLPPFRHFLARVSDDSSIRRGVGFFLQDHEVETFLASRPVDHNGEMDWVDGTIISETPVEGTMESKPDIDGQIRNALLKMKADGKVSLSQVQKDVFGDMNMGGSHFRQVQAIWKEIQSETTTTTGNMPGSSPVAA